jgi:hypothetical protein
MSATLLGLVWDHAPCHGRLLLTLLALADAADDAGEGSTALAVLAHLSRQPRVAVVATLRLLERAGLLTLGAPGDDASTHVHYRLPLDRLRPPGPVGTPAAPPQEVR